MSPRNAADALHTGLAPVVFSDTRLVVLGSFPGAASLAAQQYYGHPRNQFWRVLSALWNVDLVACDYAARLDALRLHQVGLWDLYATCRRAGSLDSAIRDAQANDLGVLLRRAPALRAIAHHGGESARAMTHSAALGVAAAQVPSTSPANAGWSFDRKLAAWRSVFQEHGVA